MSPNRPPKMEWKPEDRYVMHLQFSGSRIKQIWNRLLYQPQLIVDGNMELVHLVMKCPKNDVTLSDGKLSMVKCSPYASHLASVPEWQLVWIHKSISYTKLTNEKNWNVIITALRILESSIRIFWTWQVRVHVHAEIGSKLKAEYLRWS